MVTPTISPETAALFIQHFPPSGFWVFLKIFIYLFIYFWLRWVFVAVCGLSLVVVSRDYSLLHGLLIVVASLVVDHGL